MTADAGVERLRAAKPKLEIVLGDDEIADEPAKVGAEKTAAVTAKKAAGAPR